MNGSYIEISMGQLVLGALLMSGHLGLSFWLRLGMGKRIVIAALRMTLQLLLVGMILQWVFSLASPLIIVLLAFAMAGSAGIAAVGRTKRRYPGIFRNSIVTIIASSFLVAGLGANGILQVEPWYNPQYQIPMLGMLLGNALTGISLAMDRFMDGMVDRRNVVETMLCLGATRWEAAHPEVKEAVRTGMIPIMNAMMVMGIVSLPGMMTGQILAGADPVDAVRYQILIVFMIASTVALAVLGVTITTFYALFSPRHRLLGERLSKK